LRLLSRYFIVLDEYGYIFGHEGVGLSREVMYALLQILLINKGFTSVENIQDVKRNMEYFLHLVSILPEIKNI
jgi:hypothetical protein